MADFTDSFPSFANLAELKNWLQIGGDQPAPTNAATKLRSATIIVARACNLNPYQPDVLTPDNTPALRDATCAQVAEWLRLGIEPGALLGGSGGVKKSSMLGDTVERDTTGDTARLDAAGRDLCVEASDILLAAGLLWQALPLGDGMATMPDFGLGVACVVPGLDEPPSGYWWDGELLLWP